MLVIAKGYGGRPYVREIVSEAGSSYILANPDCDSATRTMLAPGVGFPKSCVFEFDSKLQESLEAAWATHDDGALIELWDAALPVH
jgi:hypothetical protein